MKFDLLKLVFSFPWINKDDIVSYESDKNDVYIIFNP
jgi:hypothetical protein